jgi:cell division protein ZapA
MAQVSVQIDGKTYRMACEDGQEPHIERLAADLDRRIVGLRQNVGEIGDMRLTIMGALMLADEAQDMQARLVAAEARVADMNRQVADLEKARAREANETGKAIIALAERIERISRSMSAGGNLPEE